MSSSQVTPSLVAYRLARFPLMPIVPATPSRSWMVNTPASFANHCLPLLIANQAGWFVLNSHEFQVTWDGAEDPSGISIEWLKGSAPGPIMNLFGSGIITWHIPYLFRTSPGYNLLVRGPANWPKAGASPLEGLVETDWALSTFTMSWKLTAPGVPVTFSIGEPICQLVPQRRGELEGFRPKIEDLRSGTKIGRGYTKWARSRHDVAERGRDLAMGHKIWQGHYTKGILVDGTPAPEHQTRLNLRPFTDGRELRYTEDDLWVLMESNETATIGLTLVDQWLYGGLVSIDLPQPGAQIRRLAKFGEIEWETAVIDLVSPIDGEIVVVNQTFGHEPDEYPWGTHREQWILQAKMKDPPQVQKLLTTEEYLRLLAERDF